VLRSTTSNPYGIRDITPTTKRLVERCLGGEWCAEGSGKEGKGVPSPGGQQGSMSTMTDVAAALGVDAQAQAEEAAGDDQQSGLSKSMDDLKLGAVIKLSPDERLPSGLTVLPGKRQASLPSRSPPHLSPLATTPLFYNHENSTAPHLSSAQTAESPVEHLSPSSAPDHPSPLGAAARSGQRRKPPAPPVNRATKGRVPLVAGGARRGTETVEEGRFGWQTFA
jgi:hypothetical protein